MIKYDMEISRVRYIFYYVMHVILIDMIYSILIYYDQNGDILFLIYEKRVFYMHMLRSCYFTLSRHVKTLFLRFSDFSIY